eukprot:scaffold260854_cov31-Tisochrysis_lutea.AAC.2
MIWPQYTKCPPINCQAVPFVEEHFGCDVWKSAHDGVAALRDDLAVAEAGQLQMPVSINEQVLRFKVAVRDPSIVEVL